MPRFYSQVPTGARSAGLTASALRLYLYLDERAGQRGAWYDTQAALAAGVKCSRRTVTRATVELRRAGLLTTEERPDQVLAYFVIHRQERLRGTTEMSQGYDRNVAGPAKRPYKDHKDPPQRTTRNHGSLESVIRRA